MRMCQMGTDELIALNTTHKPACFEVREVYLNRVGKVGSCFTDQPVEINDESDGFRVFGDPIGNRIIVTRTARHRYLNI